MDVSADLTELGRTPVTVVCAGVKSILDIPRTLEYLETQVTSPASGMTRYLSEAADAGVGHGSNVGSRRSVLLTETGLAAVQQPCVVSRERLSLGSQHP